jgi:murein DD-endopeptidase MepM/ murein hydrolase activator NlpD
MVGNQPMPMGDPLEMPEAVQVTVIRPEPIDLGKTLMAQRLQELLAVNRIHLEGEGGLPVLSRALRERQGPESLIWPVEGPVVGAFGWYRHPLYQDWRYHPGIEIAVAEGEPVRAGLHGQVQLVEETGPGYFRVVIDHGEGWLTTYDNLDRVNVARGQIIAQGQPVGWTGKGNLLFTLRQGGKTVDPRQFIR